jgi:2-keto-4-pentenoate hydratase/2-oxohepta-3-ene-1,7-dioic acid hydratase in catechol pathway
MKLVTYSRNQKVSCGILTGEGVIDILSIWHGPKLARRNKLYEGGPPRNVKEILQRGPDCFAKLAELTKSTDIVTPLEEVKLLAPIPRPGKIIALAGNYSEHIREVGRALGLSDSPRQTTVPRPFIMPATVVIGPGEEIPWPAYSEQIDY